eukprot:scaffold76922_cov29-Prasinocladus_malaysianus.AAC.1
MACGPPSRARSRWTRSRWPRAWRPRGAGCPAAVPWRNASAGTTSSGRKPSSRKTTACGRPSVPSEGQPFLPQHNTFFICSSHAYTNTFLSLVFRRMNRIIRAYSNAQAFNITGQKLPIVVCRKQLAG